MLSPYLVENRHVAIKRCRHGLFMYNRNDAFVGRGLDLYGEWCEFEIQLMRLVLRRATSRSMPAPTSAPTRSRSRTWSGPPAWFTRSSRSGAIS